MTKAINKNEFISALIILGFILSGQTIIILMHKTMAVNIRIYSHNARPNIYIKTLNTTYRVYDYKEALRIVCEKMNS